MLNLKRGDSLFWYLNIVTEKLVFCVFFIRTVTQVRGGYLKWKAGTEQEPFSALLSSKSRQQHPQISKLPLPLNSDWTPDWINNCSWGFSQGLRKFQSSYFRLDSSQI